MPKRGGVIVGQRKRAEKIPEFKKLQEQINELIGETNYKAGTCATEQDTTYFKLKRAKLVKQQIRILNTRHREFKNLLEHLKNEVFKVVESRVG